MRTEFAVERHGQPQVARETFTKVEEQCVLKQSGGHGQFGVCEIEVDPLERGAGFEFVDKTTGGSVPKFVPSVEKGLGCRRGRRLARYPTWTSARPSPTAATTTWTRTR
jgi:translation elongation factor EF-G